MKYPSSAILFLLLRLFLIFLRPLLLFLVLVVLVHYRPISILSVFFAFALLPMKIQLNWSTSSMSAHKCSHCHCIGWFVVIAILTLKSGTIGLLGCILKILHAAIGHSSTIRPTSSKHEQVSCLL